MVWQVISILLGNCKWHLLLVARTLLGGYYDVGCNY